MDKVAQLALDIAKCSELSVAFGDRQRPCHEVVRHQESLAGGYRHVPEAWAGDLERARILFVSSNPSISTPETPSVGEDYPLGGFEDLNLEHPDWPEDRLIAFQTQRLDQNRPRPFVNSRAQFLCHDHEYRGADKASATKKSQSYWKNAFDQASDLLGPGFDLSHDLCMTEIVHCKSKAESGAVKAAPLCAQRFFHRILDISTARLVVIVGRIAREIVVTNCDVWRSQGGSDWSISPQFGQLNRAPIQPADHVGLIKTTHRQHVVVAVQQLSWATNKYRNIERVIGSESKERLLELLRAPEQTIFGSRDELLRYLKMS